MTALIRAELMQLRTLRSTYAVAAAAILLAAGHHLGGHGRRRLKSLDSARELRDALVMASGSSAHCSWRCSPRSARPASTATATIAQRALASPHRGRMLAARLVTYGGLSALISAAALGASYLIAGPVLESKHMALALGSSDLLRIAGEVVAGSTLFGMLGVAVGFICRSQAAAIIVVFGTFLAEKILVRPDRPGTRLPRR